MREDIARVYTDARAAAEARGHGLRITLVLGEAPALMRLPWEFMFERPVFLSQSRETPIVRGLDVSRAREPTNLSFPLRILALSSAPRGTEVLDTNAEQRKLQQALGPLIERGIVDLRWLADGTLSGLERALTEHETVHVLHYVGHGGYDEGTHLGTLEFENADGSADSVAGVDLCALLSDQSALRLVVLNSCEGARTSAADPFSGVATSLLECRIPAVVGMQFEISDEAAITFAERLYTGLASRRPIDEALALARKAMFAAGHGTEFGTPVLYLAPGRSLLFDVDDPLESVVAPEPDAAAEPRGELQVRPQLELEVAGSDRDADIIARVRVTTEAATSAPSASSLDVTVLLTPSEHLETVGETLRQLKLQPGERQSEPVEFRLRLRDNAAHVTQPAVGAMILYEGRSVGTVRRTLPVSFDRARPGRPQDIIGASGAALRVQAGSVAPDLTVQILRAEAGHWLCSVTSPLLDDLAVPEPSPWVPTQPLSQLVDACIAAFTLHGASDQQRRDALVEAGRELFRASPPVFQQAFWLAVDQALPIRSILVITSELDFPWELLIPHRGFESRPALGAQYSVGRWFDNDAAAPPQQLTLDDPLVIAPSYLEAMLAMTHQEAAMVQSALGGRMLVPATYDALETELRARPTGVIHFAGHGDTRDGMQQLLLENDQRLHSVGLERMAGLTVALARDRPLVFLDASGIGRHSASASFVRSLMRMGASAVIAPAWAVSDHIANEVAREFYGALAADPRRPFADILRELRQRAYEGSEQEDSWAAYCLFGDPLASREA